MVEADADGTTSNSCFLPTMDCFLEYFNPVSDRPYDCVDTKIETNILRLLYVAHKFGAGEYVETIDIKI